jgi:hypothetical protein
MRPSVNVPLPRALYEELAAAAAARGLSLSYLARYGMRYFLDRLAPVEEFRLTKEER